MLTKICNFVRKIWNFVRGYKQFFLGLATLIVSCFGSQMGLTDKQIIEITAFLGGAVIVNKVGNKVIKE